MQPSILIASPDPQFAEPLLGKLEATGDYHVRWVQRGRDALQLVSRISFDVLILDFSLDDLPAPTLRNMILEICPDVHILEYPGWQGIEAEAPDTHTFPQGARGALIHSLADLLERDAGELSAPLEESSMGVPVAAAGSTWLQNRNRTAQILVAFLMETKAHAAMLVWQSEVFASAGDLEKSALDEILSLVSRDWNGGSRVDLTRFIRFGDGTRYCLYASPLEESILVIVQDLSMPFSQVRMQAAQLGYVLSELPQLPDTQARSDEMITLGEDNAPEFDQPGAVVALKVDDLASPSAGGVEPDGETEFELDEAKALSLSELFASMPSPNPEPEALEAESLDDEAVAPSDTLDEADDVNEVRLPWDTYEVEEAPGLEVFLQPEDAATLENPPADGAEPDAALTEESIAMDITQQIITRPEAKAPEEGVGDEPDPGGQNEAPADNLTGGQEFEHEFVFNRLAYTFVLIPRIPQHTLTGEIAERVKQWVPALCLAHGLRLARLALQAECLMWSVRVGPDESPAHMVRLLRQHTSQRLFSVFGYLKEQNPSGEFWAEGFLVIGGLEPPTPQWMQAYIQQTRARQGITAPTTPS